MISVLITIKDRQAYLDRQLESLTSLLPSSGFGWEIVIYDDGSQPKLNIPVLDSRVKLIRGNETVGLIEARNILARQTSPDSKYLFFLDDDIFIHNLALYISDSIRELDRGYSCVSAPYINLPTYKYEKISTFKHILDIKKTDNDTVYFFGGTSIFNRSDFIQAGGLEGNYFIYLEEEDLALRMYSMGMRIKIMYGSNYIAIHDQAPGKNFIDRRVYLLSNRFLFHYKFIENNFIRTILNFMYTIAYLAKFHSPSLITKSNKRYSAMKTEIEQQKIKKSTIFKFLIKRYFNV